MYVFVKIDSEHTIYIYVNIQKQKHSKYTSKSSFLVLSTPKTHRVFFGVFLFVKVFVLNRMFAK